MSDRQQPERKDVLHEAVCKVAEMAMDEEFRLADYLRVDQLTDDADSEGIGPVSAGWMSEYQWEQEKSDG